MIFDRNVFMKKLFFVLLTTVALISCSKSFTPKQIAQIENDIKLEYEKMPLWGDASVTLIKESDNRLTGFVKSEHGYTHKCTVTLDKDGGKWFWECN
jgi:hypothetical protein